MQDQINQQLATFGYFILAGLGLFLLRIILSIVLRPRLAPGLVPDVADATRPDGMSRFLALLGHRARVPETLGSRRLRATLGLRLLFWAVCGAMAFVLYQMDVPALGLETLLLAFVVYLAIHTSLYEITFDRDSVTLPRWWFGHSTRKWRDLDAVTERQGWYLVFHFRDGTAIQAHKYVVGYAELREAARKALREA